MEPSMIDRPGVGLRERRARRLETTVYRLRRKIEPDPTHLLHPHRLGYVFHKS
jgi:DNA-binding response OmpR family regulator